MSIKLKLQNLSEWVNDSAKAAKGAVELTLESGLLKDSLDDLCELGGVTGALFKLGSRAIPDPTPEQRIAARLHKTFLTAFDRELRERPDVITEEIWRTYKKERLAQVAVEKLSAEFTWLSIFGSRGRKPGRSWPMVGELADLGRTWIAEMAATTSAPAADVQRLADDARGRIHEALTQEIDQLVADPVIVQALSEAQPRTTREALELLAQELTTLHRYRLFGEIPQDTVYIPARVKVADLQETKTELDWPKIAAQQGGDRILLKMIQKGHPRLLVIEGEMGVGKSCLIRLLTSRLAEAYLSDRRHAPVHVRWRDVYSEPDLAQAIADEVSSEYGRPLHELADQADIVYLIDGFDEMSSHQEGYVTECFNRLAKLVQRNCSVVVAMRSTVITSGLRLAWKNRDALVAQVQDFKEMDVDTWAEKWSKQIGGEGVTGERLRLLGGEGVADNPLLLYMLAKYVEPAAKEKNQLRRTEVFRIFVDETIRGKLRASREDFPFHIPEQDYRLLLQELAYLASWPKHSPKCPTRVVRDRISDKFWRDLNFKDLRTAFVLHFFEPGDSSGNEFEFQPEGFRQYLLAEWCVRAQFDALRDEKRPIHPLARTREQAVEALAQFPLREEERKLLDGIYEEIGGLSLTSPENLTKRLPAFGLAAERAWTEPKSVHRLYERVRDEAQEPPQRNWDDEKVGIPAGQEVPPGLNQTRLLFNYWDQCLLATLSLYRGLNENNTSEVIFDRDQTILGRFLRTWHVARGFTWLIPINLSNLSLQTNALKGITIEGQSLKGSDLTQADLEAATIHNADLDYSVLDEAHIGGAYLLRSSLRNASLKGANLLFAIMDHTKLVNADLTGANLNHANLFSADLTNATLAGTSLHYTNLANACLINANLSDARLVEANMTNASLANADLTGAAMNGTLVSGADLFCAKITPEQLALTLGCPKRLPDGSSPAVELENKTADPGNPNRPRI